MSHFQRSQYRIAPHYMHDYARSPMGLHPLMPLLPVLPTTEYGNPYGWIGEIQQKQRANVDSAIAQAKAIQNTKKFLTYLPTAPNEMYLAPTNTYGAGHKAAYWLAMAAMLGPYPGLIVTAADIEAGTRSNEDANVFGLYKPGFSEDSGKINEVLSRAVVALDQAGLRDKKLFAGVYAVLGVAADKAKQEVTQDIREQTGTGGQVTSTPVDPAGGELITPSEQAECGKSWKSYIPGYCEAEKAGELAVLAAKIAGGVVVAGAVYMVLTRKTPLRSNPSAEAKTDFGPEADIAKMPKAVEQERRLLQNVFTKGSR